MNLGYTYIETEEELFKIVPDVQSCMFCGLDTETTGLDVFVDKLLLVQLKIDKEIYVIKFCDKTKKLLTYILGLLAGKDIRIVGHNIGFEIKFIYHNLGVLIENAYDTMLAYILTKAGTLPKFPSYEELTYEYCGVQLDKTVRKSFIGWDKDYFTEEQLLYSALDVKYLDIIKDKIDAIISTQKQDNIRDLENDVTTVFAMMEYNGINLDEKAWKENSIVLQKQADEAKVKLDKTLLESIDFTKYSNALELATFFCIPVKTKKEKQLLESTLAEYATQWFVKNFNFNSPKQVFTYFRYLGMDIANTNEKTISKLQDKYEIIEVLLDYRDKVKRVGTYGDNFLQKINPVTGRIHTQFNQLGTATGRASSEDPNLQNIPKESNFRHCFIAPQGYKILKADYSQAELRLMASVSGEPEMINSYLRGEDLHKTSARGLYDIKETEEVSDDKRQRGKTLNFGLIYGISAYGLFRNFKIPLEEGERLVNKYFSFYGTLKFFIEKAGDIIWRNKYSRTPLGRKRFFEDKTFFAGGSKDAYAYEAMVKREGVNHIIQGGIADVIKIAMVNVFRKTRELYGDGVKLLLQVHDELVFLIRDDLVESAQKVIEAEMVAAGELCITKVPVIVDCNVEQFWKKG